MTKQKEKRIRVFDSKGNFQQSYSSALKGSEDWARDCAKYSKGYAQMFDVDGQKEVFNATLCDFRPNK